MIAIPLRSYARRQAPDSPFALRALLSACLATFIYSAGQLQVVSETAVFFGLTLFLIGFIVNETRVFTRVENGSPASPVVLASVYVILITYGIGNFAFLLPEERLLEVGVENPGFGVMSRLVLMAILAAIGMWAGYRTRAAAQTGFRLRSSFLMRWWLRRQFDSLNWGAVLLFVLLSSGARLAAFALGIYGYNSDPSRLAATASFRQYLSLAQDAGTLALVAVSLRHFALKHPTRSWALWALIGVEVAWGFLSGFKSAVAMPIIIVMVCSLLVSRRVSRSLLVTAVLLLGIAYAIIEPYRQLRFADANFDNTSAEYVTKTLVDVAQGNAQLEHEIDTSVGTTALLALLRMSFVEVGARALIYKDEVGLQPDDPPFLLNLVLGPVYAMVPRILWPSKPQSETGLWFYRVVTGDYNGNTAVSPSHVGYLYLAGGTIAVVIGFWFLGYAQRVTMAAFGHLEAGSALILVGLMGALVMVNPEFSTFVVTYIRYYFILLVAQGLMFRS